MSRDPEYIAMINTLHWRKLRKAKLSDSPLCEECSIAGRLTSASEVHHIKPVESAMNIVDKRNLMFDMSNLMSVCHDCHVKLHRLLGSTSRKSRQIRADEHRQEFQRKFFGEE